jgi:pilus assembly protein CpaE
MTNLAQNSPTELPFAKLSGDVIEIYRAPQISIHAFCETAAVSSALNAFVADRRMARAHSNVQLGGVAVAIKQYGKVGSPNLLIIECSGDAGTIHAELDALANVCHAGTKVIVIGHTNDVGFYRDLLVQGISEYLVAPLDLNSLIAVIYRLYREPGAKKLGRSFAFVGAKGGVGSSSVAHNVAATIGRLYGASVILADLDLRFGTASLDFKLDASEGVAEVLQDPTRVDDMFLERLLNKRDRHLSILTSPATLEKFYDLQDGAFDRLLEVAQTNVSYVALDVPHVWTSWARKILLAADEVVITAAPDLVSLRNAKNMIEYLKQARPNDGPPKLVLNQIGMPKRTEIKSEKYAAALQIQPIALIPFEPSVFSAAANEGCMIAEMSPRAKACSRFNQIAQTLTGRERPRTSWKERLGFARRRKGQKDAKH